MINETSFQIGKNGLTDNIIEALNNALKKHNQIRIRILKSSGRDNESIKEITEKMNARLNYWCSFRIIGFTVILRKQSVKPKNY